MAEKRANTMSDDGRAAIIIGGNTEYESNGSIKGARDKAFLNYLYSRYNVRDVINVSGKLYAKQGTTYPVRLILIDGRKSYKAGYAPVQSEARAEPITAWSELWARTDAALSAKSEESIVENSGKEPKRKKTRIHSIE